MKIESNKEALDGLYDELFDDPAPVQAPHHVSADMSDGAIVKKAMAAKNADKFSRLFYDGDIIDYGGDDSRADSALCKMLTFWTQAPVQIDSIFRSSQLMRPKWDRKTGDSTYGEITIQKAIALGGEVYQGEMNEEQEPSGTEGDAYQSPAVPESPEECAARPYDVVDGCLVRYVAEETGPKNDRKTEWNPRKLTNFTAYIKREIIYDDSAVREHVYEIEGRLASGRALPLNEVSAAAFSSMRWVADWSANAVLPVGQTNKDHVRAAIQHLSINRGFETQVIYSHIGWRDIDGVPSYLSAGSAINANGLNDIIEVDLRSDSLNLYALPAPPVGDERIAAVREVLALLDGAKEHKVGGRAIYPPVCRMYRAPLCEFWPATSSEYFAGLTGAHKTSIQLAAMTCFGARFDAQHTPSNWSSTPNIIEKFQWIIKDAPFTIDDWVPTADMVEASTKQRSASRVFHGAGNTAGRQRMNSKRGFDVEYYSRGFTGSNGEDIPFGQSTRGRMLIISITRDDIDLDFLSEWQRKGREGVYAAATAAFIQWLAANYDELRDEVRQVSEKARDKFRDLIGDDIAKMHERTPTTLADFAVGLDYFLTFAVDIGAIDQPTADDHHSRCADVLLDLAYEQIEHLRTADPTAQFVDLIRAAIMSGRAHVCDVSSNKVPTVVEPTLWGWTRGREQVLTRDGYEQIHESAWVPQGLCIGWIQADLATGVAELYLEPTASYNVAQSFGHVNGSGIGLSKDTLWDGCKEKGLLKRCDDKRTTINKKIQKKSKRVACMNAERIVGKDDTA